MNQDDILKARFSLNLQGRLKTFYEPTIMGILNTTPDSFFRGSRKQVADEALKATEKMLDDGADIIDMGGYSSRPGAPDVPEEEEKQRLLPILSSVRKNFPKAIISVDTFRAGVAEEALNEGGNIINDISAGDADPAMMELIGQKKPPYIMMHKQGTPQTMQNNPQYKNVNKEVMLYFAKKVEAMHEKGCRDLILDPGFGFGKTVDHNYELLANLNLYKNFKLPLLVGLSRKSMVNKVLETSPEEALNGTTVLHTLALQQGCDILRVHDVKEAKEAVKLTSFYGKFA